jgi:hypothetical protein
LSACLYELPATGSDIPSLFGSSIWRSVRKLWLRWLKSRMNQMRSASDAKGSMLTSRVVDPGMRLIRASTDWIART